MNKENSFSIHLLFALLFILISLILYYTITSYGAGAVIEKARIGFILDGDRRGGGWNESNAEGIYAAKEELDFELFFVDNINGSETRLYNAVKDMADGGCRAIILSSDSYADIIEKYIGDFPDIVFFCDAPYKGVHNLVSFSARIYQARYLSGVIAGKMTESGNIGYIAAFPSANVNQGINAFTLGARKENANVTVDVMFTDGYSARNKETACAESLINDYGCDILTVHASTNNVLSTAESKGVYYIGFHKAINSDRELACVSINWDRIYTELLKEYMRGTLSKSKSYWYGLEDDYVELSALSPLLPDYVRSRVESEKKLIIEGNDVFTNMIRDTEGNIVCRPGESMPDSALTEDMYWYSKGVNIIDDRYR